MKATFLIKPLSLLVLGSSAAQAYVPPPAWAQTYYRPAPMQVMPPRYAQPVYRPLAQQMPVPPWAMSVTVRPVQHHQRRPQSRYSAPRQALRVPPPVYSAPNPLVTRVVAHSFPPSVPQAKVHHRVANVQQAKFVRVAYRGWQSRKAKAFRVAAVQAPVPESFMQRSQRLMSARKTQPKLASVLPYGLDRYPRAEPERRRVHQALKSLLALPSRKRSMA